MFHIRIQLVACESEMVHETGIDLPSLILDVMKVRSGGPGSIPGTIRKKQVVDLEWGPLSLVSTTEELLDKKKK
jgi:hypothetical protein